MSINIWFEKINEDTSDDDMDEMIEFNKDKARTIYRKDTNEKKYYRMQKIEN